MLIPHREAVVVKLPVQIDLTCQDQAYPDVPPTVATCELRLARPATPRLADPWYAALSCTCQACNARLSRMSQQADVAGEEEVWLSPHAELQALSDTVLLARLRSLPHESIGREAICEVLITRYEGLVRSCVRPYLRSPESPEDLLQVGFLGLLKAINNFDPGIGESLAAYALPCISGEIKRHFRDRRWQLRVPRQAQELRLEMRAVEDALTQRLGSTPGDGELARYLGVREEDVLEARQADLAFSIYSLDAPPRGDDPGALADMVGEDDAELAHAIDMEAVRAHLGQLPERQQRIVMLRSTATSPRSRSALASASPRCT